MSKRDFGDGIWEALERAEGLNHDEKTAVYEDISTWGEVVPQIRLQWVETLVRVVGELCDDGNAHRDTYARFWIHLYGVLTEVHSFFHGSVYDIATKEIPEHQRTDVLRVFLMVSSSLESLRGRFEQDELIYLEYKRHSHAHVEQKNYRVRVTKKKGGIPDGLRDELTLPILDGKKMSLESVDAALVAVIEAGNRDEMAIARTFANRIRMGVDILATCLRTFTNLS